MKKSPIKIEQQFKEIMRQERDKFYLVVYGDVVSLNGKFIGSYDVIFKNYYKIAGALGVSVKEAKKSSERVDAMLGLSSIMILPFRIQ
jgi:hypothetical protein